MECHPAASSGGIRGSVLALRHFEMLTNEQAARVLGLKKSAASSRYLNALKRLKHSLAGLLARD